jgi:hypothetical protein
LCKIGISQERIKPDWIGSIENQNKMFSRDTFFFFTSFIELSGSDDYIRKSEKLSLDLKQGLASSIKTSVKTEFKSQSTQVNNNSSMNFVSTSSKNSQILVDIDLPESIIKIWPENYVKSEKKIYGIIAVRKSILRKSLISSVSVALNDIDRELIGSPRSKSNNELIRIIDNSKVKIEEVVNKISLIKSIDNDFDDNSYFESLKQLSIKLDNFSSALSNKEYEDMYNRAKRLLDDNKCRQALNEYKILNRLNSSDERVVRERQSAQSCVNQSLLLEAAQFTSKNEFIKAVSIYDSLIMLNPENSNLYEKDRKNSIDKYFIQSFNLIEVYLQSNLSEAKKILDGIQVFGTSEYNSRIDDLRIKTNSLFFKHRTLEFRNAINQKKFSNANQIISIIGKENATTPNITKRLSLMGKKLNKATYSFEKKQLLNSRPNLFCVNFNFALGSQYLRGSEISEIGKSVSFDKAIYPTLSQLIPTYSISIFRKINIVPRFSRSLRDKSKSNLIGFEFGYNDFNNLILVDKPYFYGYNINSFNLQFSTTFYKLFNFKYGVNSGRLTKFDIKNDLFVTTLGIKIPVYYFNLDFNVNYISDYQFKNLFNLESTISYKLNFKKRYSQVDRDFVKLKSQNWRL